jgi:DNA-binding NarL/FixJ family response regulator
MIKVAVVAEVRLYREGLAQILGRHANIKVVATAASTNGSLSPLSELVPDCVLIDMAMPDSVAAIRRVVAAVPAAKVVSLGVADDDRNVLASAEAGASGYVPREGSLEDLVAIIESAVRGEAVCSPRIAAALLRRVASLARDRSSNEVEGHLTSREREITRLIDQGLSNKEIAVRLCIEVATVKNHVHNILEKLQVHRRGEAAARLRGALPRQSREPGAIR